MKKSCKNCGTEFEANSNAHKFCSDQCKMDAAMQAGGTEVKKASEVEVPKYTPGIVQTGKADVDTMYKQLLEIRDAMKVFIPLKEFCEKESITPADLIQAYKDRFKAKKAAKEPKTDQATEEIKPVAKNKQMKEPEPGTNAYFLRYGKYRK